MIRSSKFITIVSSNHKTRSGDTSLVYPVTILGQEYYVVTASGKRFAKEFAVFGLQDSTSVTVELRCTVTFEGKTYKPHEKLSVHIDTSEVLYLESAQDCTGSRVVSDKPVGVMSGHACAWTNTKCQHVYEQLLPVEQWGTSFIVPALENQALKDFVFIVASKPTLVTYQFGDKPGSVNLGTGGWVWRAVVGRVPGFIFSNQPIQVIYYCTGGKFTADSVIDPFMMNIVPTVKFCETYTLEGKEDFNNYALIVAETKDIKEVQFGDEHPSIKWHQVPGTEYSSANYYYLKGRGQYTVKSPGAPIGVYSVGQVDRDSYGAPAACGLLTCAHNGQYYPSGKPFWEDSACTKLCECNPSTGLVSCQKSQCKAGEECKLVECLSECVAKTIPASVIPPKGLPCIHKGQSHPPAKYEYTYMTVFMFNFDAKEKSKNQLYITSYLPDTNVLVTVNKTPFKKELSLQRGESVTVELPSDTELSGTGRYSKSVMIRSSKFITIVSSNHKTRSGDTSLVYPVTILGQEYYVVTASGKRFAKEFAVFGLQDSTSVTVELRCTVTFEGKTYKPHEKLSVHIDTSEVLYLESAQDCTGSRVVSDKPVGVMSGHACAWTNTKCQHVYEQLLPVEQWGTSFIVPALENQALKDFVFIVASKPTLVTYQFGDKPGSVNLGTGGWVWRAVVGRVPGFIFSNQPIQVIYYCTGGKFTADSVIDPFMMNIVPTVKFCETYTLEGKEDFNNYALIVAETKDIKEVQFGDEHPSIKWHQVPGTEYSSANYYYLKGRGQYTVKSPGAPIGVYSVGQVDRDSYGAPAACGLQTCTHNGQHHPPGKPFWEDSACTKLCHCDPSTGLVSCQKSQCKVGEECKVVEGAGECVAKIIPSPVHPPKEYPYTYITVFIFNANQEGKGKKLLYIRSYLSDTNVLVTVNKSPFKKELTMQGGESVTVELPSDTELRDTGKYSKTVMIRSSKVITIGSSNHKKNSVDTSLVYSMTKLGQEYYVFIPLAWGYPKEVAVFGLQDSTSVTVELKCAVTFEGKPYAPNEKLTARISTSEVLYLKSNQDCTGTRVVSDKPVGVISGHDCASKNSKCQHTFEQLLPVEQWGTSFIVPPVEYQVSVYILASSPTRVTYQLGSKSEDINLSAGQWKEISMDSSPPLVISSTQPVQVLYYCTGGKFSDGSSFDPFIMDIEPTEEFYSSYTLEGKEDFSNQAFIVAKTKDIKEVQFDDKRPSFKWQQVHGTEYSWTQYTYKKGRGHHILMHPSAPIGVYSMGSIVHPSFSGLTCSHNGQYHPPGKLFWEDSACTKLCACDPSTGFVNFNVCPDNNPDCDCVYQGKVMKHGEAWMSADCSEKCVCLTGGWVQCEIPGCPSGGSCVEKGGVWLCSTPEPSCYLLPSGGFKSFDGLEDWVWTEGTYSLAVPAPSTQDAFRIIAHLNPFGDTLEPTVIFHSKSSEDLKVEVKKDFTTVVNGKAVSLPFRTNNGLEIVGSENTVVVQHTSGLNLRYCCHGKVTVTLTAAFRGKVAGLCGNFNGRADDDLQLRDGSVADNIEDFYADWMI
ncbi:hypothetical protein SKAU_G00418020 [Synaphobranchus kaupii]|uniref:VWFD domain-containing protein n=1 Tax=Synaphobranchus kaupii TaxID=118154 RepID=A0A9Q1E642_SYNKA|nr:hypothetical protein SKAU_G00418020 [Synaphobranchus kaupii]